MRFEMKKYAGVRTLMLGLVCATIQQLAVADGLKIGAVFPAVIFKESKIAQQMTQKIHDDFAVRDGQLATEVADFKKKLADFERDAPTLSEEQRGRTQREIADTDRELQKKQRDFQVDLETRRRSDQQRVLELINKAVVQVARDEHYDFILQDVVFAATKANLTQKVMDEMIKESGK